MKNLIVCLMAVCMSLTFIPNQSRAAESTPASIALSKSNEAAEAKALLARLDEIKAMDKSKLNSSEKKELRKEVRATRQHLRYISGGIYLSTGAVIIIVVLLIILL